MQTVAKGARTWVFQAQDGKLAYRVLEDGARGVLPADPGKTCVDVDDTGCVHLFSLGEAVVHFAAKTGSDWRRQTLSRPRPGGPGPVSPLLTVHPCPTAAYLIRGEKDVIGCFRAPEGAWKTERLMEAPKSHALTPLALVPGPELIVARRLETGWQIEAHRLFSVSPARRLWRAEGFPENFCLSPGRTDALWRCGTRLFLNGEEPEEAPEDPCLAEYGGRAWAMGKKRGALILTRPGETLSLAQQECSLALYVTKEEKRLTYVTGSFAPVSPDRAGLPQGEDAPGRFAPVPAAPQSPSAAAGAMAPDALMQTLRAQAAAISKLKEQAAQDSRRLFLMESQIKAMEVSLQAAQRQLGDVAALKAAMTVLEQTCRNR